MGQVTRQRINNVRHSGASSCHGIVPMPVLAARESTVPRAILDSQVVHVEPRGDEVFDRPQCVDESVGAGDTRQYDYSR